nr:MAG TPA: hypothetical protein [Caudoviricetes sp.]
MCYKVRKVKIRDDGEVETISRRTSTMLWPAPLRVGGLYFIGGQLVRIESEVDI